jgi:hypothetical protein
MIAYPGLYFLDVPKTGTTRIREILDFALGPAIEIDAHRPLPRQYDRRHLRLLSVRAPLALYRSLFRYGCDGRGRLFHRLAEAGLHDLYTPTQAAFTDWLDWILNPDHAAAVGLGYGAGHVAQHVGFASHMTLSLATPGARGVHLRARTRFDLTARLGRRRLRPDGVVRNSVLEQDVMAFLSHHANRLPLRHSLEDIAHVAHRQNRPNASQTGGDITLGALPPDLVRRVRERDWPLHEVFGLREHLPQIDTAACAQIGPMTGQKFIGGSTPLVPQPLQHCAVGMEFRGDG